MAYVGPRPEPETVTLNGASPLLPLPPPAQKVTDVTGLTSFQ